METSSHADARRFRLVVVPDGADVPGAVVSVLLMPGTTSLDMTAPWSETLPNGRFRGGTESLHVTWEDDK